MGKIVWSSRSEELFEGSRNLLNQTSPTALVCKHNTPLLNSMQVFELLLNLYILSLDSRGSEVRHCVMMYLLSTSLH